MKFSFSRLIAQAFSAVPAWDEKKHKRDSGGRFATVEVATAESARLSGHIKEARSVLAGLKKGEPIPNGDEAKALEHFTTAVASKESAIDDLIARLKIARAEALKESPPAVATSLPVAQPVERPRLPAIERGEVRALPTGRELAGHYEVVDIGSLMTSDHPAFPKELQPRDRSGRQASHAQILSNAAKLNPMRMTGDYYTTDSGPPLVGPDGIVESGNGRVMMLRTAYSNHPERADAYRARLKKLGYNIDGMSQPMEVFRRTEDLPMSDRVVIARDSNSGAIMTMSPAEKAMSDSKGLTPSIVGLYRGGDLGASGNAEFRQAFLATVPSQEHNELVDAKGQLSGAGIRRIENAMLAKAYNDSDLISKLTESVDNNIVAVGKALVDASPEFMNLRAGIEAGSVDPSVDLSQVVVHAAKFTSDARARGDNPVSALEAGDLFGNAPTKAVQDVVRLFFNDKGRGVSREKLAESLKFLAAEAMKQQPGAGLFGDALPPLKPEDITSAAHRRAAA